MIRIPTVFVLGAGAHCSYGFPSGEQLKEQALSLLATRVVIAPYAQQLVLQGAVESSNDLSDLRISAFVKALTYAAHPSIDSFLHANRHQAGFSAIGKIAIARILLEQEGKTGIGPCEDDWIDYLFKLMLESAHDPETFLKNQIGFITFNYDRTVERSFFVKIQHSFGLSDQESLEVLRKFPLLHVYGDLGEFSLQENHFRADLAASQRIKTIFEVNQTQQPVDRAIALLADAQRVCFLGFGFHSENVKVLDMPNSLTGSKMLVASRFNITDHEWDRLRAPFVGQRFERTGPLLKCRDTLRHSPLFI